MNSKNIYYVKCFKAQRDMIFKTSHVDRGNFICELGLEGLVEEQLFIYYLLFSCFL